MTIIKGASSIIAGAGAGVVYLAAVGWSTQQAEAVRIGVEIRPDGMPVRIVEPGVPWGYSALVAVLTVGVLIVALHQSRRVRAWDEGRRTHDADTSRGSRRDLLLGLTAGVLVLGAAVVVGQATLDSAEALRAGAAFDRPVPLIWLQSAAQSPAVHVALAGLLWAVVAPLVPQVRQPVPEPASAGAVPSVAR